MAKEMKTVAVFAGVFLVMAMVAGYFVYNTSDEVAVKAQEIDVLKNELAALKKEADQHDELVIELDSLKANLAQYVKILPSPEVATPERLMELVQEKTERAQFALASYRAGDAKGAKAPQARGRGPGSASGFKEIEVSLNAEGTYEQFLRFLNSLERHESFLRVNSFSCLTGSKPTIGEDGAEVYPLTISLNVSTFRYESGGK